MTLRSVLKSQATNNYFLIYWEDEDSVTAVPSKECEGGSAVGDCVMVKIGHKKYPGKISAIGNKPTLERLEDEFISGEFTPLQESQLPPSKKARSVSSACNSDVDSGLAYANISGESGSFTVCDVGGDHAFSISGGDDSSSGNRDRGDHAFTSCEDSGDHAFTSCGDSGDHAFTSCGDSGDHAFSISGGDDSSSGDRGDHEFTISGDGGGTSRKRGRLGTGRGIRGKRGRGSAGRGRGCARGGGGSGEGRGRGRLGVGNRGRGRGSAGGQKPKGARGRGGAKAKEAGHIIEVAEGPTTLDEAPDEAPTTVDEAPHGVIPLPWPHDFAVGNNSPSHQGSTMDSVSLCESSLLLEEIKGRLIKIENNQEKILDIVSNLQTSYNASIPRSLTRNSPSLINVSSSLPSRNFNSSINFSNSPAYVSNSPTYVSNSPTYVSNSPTYVSNSPIYVSNSPPSSPIYVSSSYSPIPLSLSSSSVIPCSPSVSASPSPLSPLMSPSSSQTNKSSLCPIRSGNPSVRVLSSSEINNASLIPIDTVIRHNQKLRTESGAGKLCVKLAREAVFGSDIMRKCTPYGTKTTPGLPTKELFVIKKAIFDIFPQYWGNPVDFETLWKTCLESIQQACKRLRLQPN